MLYAITITPAERAQNKNWKMKTTVLFGFTLRLGLFSFMFRLTSITHHQRAIIAIIGWYHRKYITWDVLYGWYIYHLCDPIWKIESCSISLEFYVSWSNSFIAVNISLLCHCLCERRKKRRTFRWSFGCLVVACGEVLFAYAFCAQLWQ